METLLISPAERLEIVAGKFAATFLFSFLSAVWNVLGLTLGVMVLGLFLPTSLVSASGLLWSSAFAVPLAALFSAVSLALGTYAKSTKEGQYYLIPMFLVTMPLAFYAMTPGVRLDAANALIPIANAALLMQALMAPAGPPVGLLTLGSVTLSLGLSIAAALGWAVWQFHQEGVLFREAAQGGLGAWLRGALKGR